jgi:hypothetical protein
MARLDDQIGWYDRYGRSCQRNYKVLKIVVIVIAALIPLLSGVQLSFEQVAPMPWILGALGATIAVIEGIQQVGQYQTNWISYRSTCEALKHEKYLYLAKAGPYATAADAHALLAEHVESLVSQEHAKWASTQQVASKPAPQGGAAGGGPAPGAGDSPHDGQRVSQNAATIGRHD